MNEVQILLCTRDGAAHLGAQLASFVAQVHTRWSLWVSDDASRDATPEILAGFAAAHPGRVHLLTGPGQGAAANFLTLLGHPDRPPGAIAFADQDDVWMPHKIARALAWLGRDPAGDRGKGKVYVCRTRHTDAALRPRDLSTLHPRPPAFANALVQNILGGNTIMADPAGAAFLRATAFAALAEGVPFHDWWVYLVATGAGLTILSDPEPGLWYRQHSANLLGAHRSLGGLRRLSMIGDGRYRDWIGRNLAALGRIEAMLMPENRDLLAQFVRWRAMPPARRGPLSQLGIHRQSRSGDLLLRLAARQGRI